MTQNATVTGIAQLISLAIGPVFLLAGIGSILNVMAARLGRVIDRARQLENEFAAGDDGDRTRMRGELRMLDRRMTVVQSAIGACTGSALFVSLVVAILFVAELADFTYARPIALLFIIAMALLIVGLLLFLWEVNLAMRSVRVRRAFIARPGAAVAAADHSSISPPAASPAARH